MNALCSINLKTKDGAVWLRAHEKLRRRPRTDMPRALLERELAEWMLADKQTHTGRDFGAKPRELPFKQFMEWNAPIVNDGGRPSPRPIDAERATGAYIASEAEKCVSLWRMVIEQIAYDVLKMWGCAENDYRTARIFFEGKGDAYTEAREGVCAMAMIEPDALMRAYHSKRLKALADKAIGRERWLTRMLNEEIAIMNGIERNEKAGPKGRNQLDLFYSQEVREARATIKSAEGASFDPSESDWRELEAMIRRVRENRAVEICR